MTVLPWQTGTTPLMLAPMQGLTNRALRAYFIEYVRPDVIFTEFMRVKTPPEGARLLAADLRDIAAEQEGVPLVGHGREALVSAARAAQEAGAAHINLNMGYPYGQLFCGDIQVLNKIKEIIAYLDNPELAKPLKELRRAKTLRAFEAALDGLC